MLVYLPHRRKRSRLPAVPARDARIPVSSAGRDRITALGSRFPEDVPRSGHLYARSTLPAASAAEGSLCRFLTPLVLEELGLRNCRHGPAPSRIRQQPEAPELAV